MTHCLRRPSRRTPSTTCSWRQPSALPRPPRASTPPRARTRWPCLKCGHTIADDLSMSMLSIRAPRGSHREGRTRLACAEQPRKTVKIKPKSRIPSNLALRSPLRCSALSASRTGRYIQFSPAMQEAHRPVARLQGKARQSTHNPPTPVGVGRPPPRPHSPAPIRHRSGGGGGGGGGGDT